MPEFRYQAIDLRGRTRNGVLPAQDESDLQQKLKVLGLWLTESALRQSTKSAASAPKSKLSKLRVAGQTAAA